MTSTEDNPILSVYDAPVSCVQQLDIQGTPPPLQHSFF